MADADPPIDALAETLEVYRRRGEEWESVRSSNPAAAEFGSGLASIDRPVLDAGCGPGWDLPALGAPSIGLDAVEGFARRVRSWHPDAWPVVADLRALPFRRGSLGAAWVSRSLVHLPRVEVPLALWQLHRALRIGAPVGLTLFEGDREHERYPGDEFEGRRFSAWPEPLLRAVLEGSGFEVGNWTRASGDDRIDVRATRRLTLADTVGRGMELLLVGLNPSPYAAEVGVGFARPGNRFWPAALRAGVVTRDRDPYDALRRHGIGMTDLVKRPTARAAEIARSEFRAGLERVEQVVRWLRPGAVCVIGVTGWRAATDQPAEFGVQPAPLGGRPVYVMPNPSGLNAHTNVDDLADHLRAALDLSRRAGSEPRPD